MIGTSEEFGSFLAKHNKAIHYAIYKTCKNAEICFDDIKSEAHLLCWKFYLKSATSDEKFLCQWLTWRLTDYIRESMPYSRSVYKKMTLKERIIIFKDESSLELIGVEAPHGEEYDRQAIFKSINPSDREKIIFEALLKGHSQIEISDMIKVTPSRLNQIVKSIKDRIIEANKKENDLVE